MQNINTEHTLTFDAYFINIGYDYVFNKIILNTSFGICLDGKVSKSNDATAPKINISEEIDKNSSFNLILSIGYRGDREYGLGFNFHSIKQKGINNKDIVVYNALGNYESTYSKEIEPYYKNDLKPVIWVGFNW